MSFPSDKRSHESGRVLNESTIRMATGKPDYGSPPPAPKLRPVPDPIKTGYDRVYIM